MFKMLYSIALVLACAGGAVLARPSDMMPRAVNEKGSDGTVEVTLLHFSDWHVRVEPVKGTAQDGPGLCSQYDIDKGRCNGGLARMVSYVKQQRQLDRDLLLLNAGDDFIGTEWDRKAGVDAPAAFMNLLKVDAATIGNHEWDKGLNTLKQYLDAQQNKAILGANIDFNAHELKDKVKPYVVKYVKGKRVCIMGLTTPYALPDKGRMGPVEITSYEEVGKQVLQKLEQEGCHAKVLLSHLGYTTDQWLASKPLPGLDLVIGGHSHSFLWPDPNNPPAFFKPADWNDANCCGDRYDKTWGPYPTWAQDNGRSVPVVASSWASRYMGKVVLQFAPGKDGKVSGVRTEVTLLGGPQSDNPVQEDWETVQEIKKWRNF